MPLKIAATGCGNRVCSEELCRVLIPPVNHDCCSDAALTIASRSGVTWLLLLLLLLLQSVVIIRAWRATLAYLATI